MGDPNVPLRAKLFQSVNADKQIAAIEAELIRARAARLNEPACFIAGTLIHTREGLRPIEEIKVGDWVLSKPEEGAGERSYKRVIRTFVHESNNVWLMKANYRITDPAEFHLAAGETEIDGEKVYVGTETLGVTAEHPFFTKEDGWIAAADLAGAGRHVELANGDYTLTAHNVFQIYQSETPHLGWAPIERPSKGTGGWIVEFGAAGLNLEDHMHPQKTKYDERGFVASMVRTVYNFEVEDNHTYYVGQVGLWVHNTKFVPINVVVENEARLLNGTQPGRSLILKANHGVRSKSRGHPLALPSQ